MARARLLKPGFFSNQTLAMVHPLGRLLFAGLWTIADREGRLRDSPKYIKGQLLPFENAPVNKLLEDLDKLGFITRYTVDGEDFIAIRNFDKHQHPHVKEPESVIPAPAEHQHSPVISGTSTGKSGTSSPIAVTGIQSLDPVAVSGEGVRSLPDPEEVGFAGRYVREYETRVGKHPPGNHAAECMALVREYGEEPCIEVAKDLEWSKPPGYMRPILEDRKNGKPRLQAPGKSARGSTNGADPSDLAGWRAYQAGEA